jgi:hypothetical protein
MPDTNLLTPEQHKNIKKVVKLLENGRLTFDFRKHPQTELLCDALLLMCDVAKHGTSDGQPKQAETARTNAALGLLEGVR